MHLHVELLEKDMKFKSASYQRVKSLRNYESEQLEMFVEIEEGDDPDEVIAALRLKVNQLLEKSTQKEAESSSDPLAGF